MGVGAWGGWGGGSGLCLRVWGEWVMGLSRTCLGRGCSWNLLITSGYLPSRVPEGSSPCTLCLSERTGGDFAWLGGLRRGNVRGGLTPLLLVRNWSDTFRRWRACLVVGVVRVGI